MNQPVKFGKYLLLHRISVGGMAEVFLAKSFGVEGFEKTLAIKRILPSIAEDEDFIQMFIDEAKIAGQLSHVNICQIFELGKLKEAHFIAMEFIWGKDLLQLHNRFRKLQKAMPFELAAFIVARACEGLDYAHNKRDTMGKPLHLIHRDVSPQNVLISYEGEVKIIDFGIAKAASRSSKTRAGVLKGKFGYMSPEQVRGLALDRRSDIFAVGTLFHELLTGQRLFMGESDFVTLEKVRNVEVTPPSQINDKVPAELERIVMKALAADVADRYQWASELQDDLMAYVKTAGPSSSAKRLAGWMKSSFAPEIEKERLQIESYKDLRLDDPRLQDFDAPMPPSFASLVPAPGVDEVKTNIAKSGARQSDLHDQATQILDDAESQLGGELAGESTVMLPGGSSASPTGAVAPVAAVQVPVPAVPVAASAPVPMFLAHTTASQHRGAGVFAQVALAAGIAVLVAGVMVAGYSLVLARAPGHGATLAVAAKDMGAVTVLVDGVAWGELEGQKGEVLQAAGLSPGQHDVVAQRKGFKDCVRSVQLQDLSTHVVLCDFAKEVGILKLEMVTKDASIFIDGIEITREAAAEPQYLDPDKEHTIRVRKKGFVEQTLTERIKAGATVERRIELTRMSSEAPAAPAPVPAVAATQPSEKKRTPKSKKVATGPVEIDKRASKEARRQKRKERDAKKAAETATKKMNEPGYLAAATVPYAKVYVDGKYTGKKTPINRVGKIKLTSGKHKVEFVVGGKRYAYTVKIRPGQTTFLTKTLGKKVDK